MQIKCFFLTLLLSTTAVKADNSTLDAAIGGGLGGAVGAAIGNEVGGRDGAVIGGALGGGVGAALTTNEKSGHDDYRDRNEHHRTYYSTTGHLRPGSVFCPPGQAKKGRC